MTVTQEELKKNDITKRTGLLYDIPVEIVLLSLVLKMLNPSP
jgi:hypothetical protein